MSMKPEEFAGKMSAIYGDNLKSVVLFGSAASGEYSRKYSDYNLLVVLGKLGLDELRKAMAPVARWTSQGNPPPLFFTQERLVRSEDVFPIEFLDMQDRHRVLAGSDPFAGMEMRRDNLRLELEHELKGKLIKLREDYILTGGKPGAVRDLLARAGSTFEVLFQGVLRLHGVSPIPPKAEAAGRLNEYVPVWSGVFEYVEKLRNRDKSALKEDPDMYFEQLLRAAEAVSDHVDTWKGGDGAPR